MHLTDSQLKDLELKANDIRMTIIDMLEDAGSGHTAGPLGLSDLFAALYFNILDHDPNNWDKPDRDRLILSCGHTVPVRYAAMAHAGYFPLSETKTLRQFGSRLQGHPERVILGAMENTSGPLGEGLSQAAGMAYAAKMDGAKWRTYCVMSDGEQQAGNIWEPGSSLEAVLIQCLPWEQILMVLVDTVFGDEGLFDKLRGFVERMKENLLQKTKSLGKHKKTK